jgi:hypothetical protein
MEMPMRINGNFMFHSAAAAPLFLNTLPEPLSAGEPNDPLQSLEWRLLTAQQLVRPGFMTLRAVRKGTLILDFMWTFASAGAGRMLEHPALDLCGKRLLDVLERDPGREAVFEQYRRVVEQGAAGAAHVHQARGARDTIRHGAVRLGDGVAVTLINLGAAHRADALALALRSQQAMVAAAAYSAPATCALSRK